MVGRVLARLRKYQNGVGENFLLLPYGVCLVGLVQLKETCVLLKKVNNYFFYYRG